MRGRSRGEWVILVATLIVDAALTFGLALRLNLPWVGPLVSIVFVLGVVWPLNLRREKRLEAQRDRVDDE